MTCADRMPRALATAGILALAVVFGGCAVDDAARPPAGGSSVEATAGEGGGWSPPPEAYREFYECSWWMFRKANLLDEYNAAFCAEITADRLARERGR